jgi:hypothetical protein
MNRSDRSQKMLPRATDPVAAERLWRLSEQLTAATI